MMGSSLPGSRKVGQVGQVGQTMVVPGVPRGTGQGPYTRPPVPPTLVLTVPHHLVPAGCPSLALLKQAAIRKTKTAEPWPPPGAALPDNSMAIEAGRVNQQELFPLGELPPATSKATARKRMTAPYPT